MSGVCAVYGCSNTRRNTKHKDIRYFKFPKDENVRKTWIIRCWRADKFNIEYAQICSLHFTHEDFKDAVQSHILGTSPKFLKNTAVPSINLLKDTVIEEPVPLCSGCSVSEMGCISKCYENNNAAIDMFRDHGVLPRSVRCPYCNKECHYRSDGHQWYCTTKEKIAKTKRYHACGFVISEYKGSFLSNSHVEPWKVLLFINAFLRKNFNHTQIFENLQFSSVTSVKWRSVCSRVTIFCMDNQKAIGGPGIVVEMDECKFNKVKGRKGTKKLQGVMVFGGIERVSKKKVLLPLIDSPYHNAETLMPVIQKYIKPGSIIHSDEWAADLKLNTFGYEHQTVNRSAEHSVDPVTGVHIQNIERLWKDAKLWVLKAGMKKEYFSEYFSRYLFVHQFFEPSSVLHHFLRQAALLFPSHIPQPKPSTRRRLTGRKQPKRLAATRVNTELNQSGCGGDPSQDLDTGRRHESSDALECKKCGTICAWKNTFEVSGIMSLSCHGCGELLIKEDVCPEVNVETPDMEAQSEDNTGECLGQWVEMKVEIKEENEAEEMVFIDENIKELKEEIECEDKFNV